MGVREDYFVDTLTYSLSDSSVREFEIPARAMGLKLKDVTVVDSNNNERSLSRYNVEDVHDVYPDIAQYPNTYSFYLKNNKVCIIGTPTGFVTLKLYFFKRPNSLVLPSSCGQITAIATSSNSITVSSLPSTFIVGTTVDIVKQNSGNETLFEDYVISSVSGTTVTFTGTLSSAAGLAIGDYMCLSEQAPVIQIPRDLYSLLAQAVAVKIAEAMGDYNGLQATKARFKEMQASVLNLITPRVEGEPLKVISNNTIMKYFSKTKRWFY